MPVVRDLECDWNDLGKWKFFQGKIKQNNTFTGTYETGFPNHILISVK
jgi:hypothetical protein